MILVLPLICSMRGYTDAKSDLKVHMPSLKRLDARCFCRCNRKKACVHQVLANENLTVTTKYCCKDAVENFSDQFNVVIGPENTHGRPWNGYNDSDSESELEPEDILESTSFLA